MKCTHILAALGIAVLALVLTGCGAFQGKTSELKSITLDVALINGEPPSSQSGFVTLVGNGGTIQLQAIGEYTGGTTQDITHVVAYSAIVDPQWPNDAFDQPLLPPCQPGSCPAPSEPPYTSGTLEYSPTGLLTAVEPATCTFVDVAPLDNGAPGAPVWDYVGDYVITVSYQGITSNPIYVPIASSAGNANLIEPFGDIVGNNPDGYCDSGSY